MPQNSPQSFSALTPAALLGLSPAVQTPAAGETLPRTSNVMGDRGGVPWSPDSHGFWLIAIGAATLMGIFGASFNIRAGKGRAGINLGKA